MTKRIIERIMAMATLAIAIFAFMTACSKDGDKAVIDARFLNMNQANFFVYSPDGVMQGIDTISVNAGRFTYSVPVMQEGTVVIIFPNYTTMPIFVTPGASIDIDANAAALKKMKVTGTDDNELYTEWRENCEGMSPAEIKKQAILFIQDHPTSPVARWLVNQYLITAPKPDMKKAQELLQMMMKATGNNVQVAKMLYKIKDMQCIGIGDRLPRFTAKDIDGKPVLNGNLQKGTAVICLWASWNYESQSMLRQLATRQKYGEEGQKMDHVIAICMDPDIKKCRKTIEDCSAEHITNICDTMMWDSPLIKSLGMNSIPDNIKLKDGKVIGLHMPVSDLLKK